MNYLTENYEELKKCVEDFHSCLPTVDLTGDLILERLLAGSTIFACGNGGSATDSMHLCEELIGRYRADRCPLPAISLNADNSALTCIGNDYGFQEVFARQLVGLGKAGDILVGFSTSGHSLNVIKVFEEARSRQIHTILLSGGDGGKLNAITDYAILVPSSNTARIQELHTFILHAWLEKVERHYVGL